MAVRLYNGLLVTVVGKEVLVNAGDRWAVHCMEEFMRDSNDYLAQSSIKEEFYQWYSVPLGGYDEN